MARGVGMIEVTEFVVYDDTLTLPDALYLAASLESASAHPIARAIVAKGAMLKRALATPYEYKEIPGQGVAGIVLGKLVEIGNFACLNAPAEQVFMFINRKLAARITLSPPPRC